MAEQQQETLLVIVGAGASFDCLDPDVDLDQTIPIPGPRNIRAGQARPPLTANLADPSYLCMTTLGNWRHARPVVDNLRLQMRRSGADRTPTLEHALAQYEERQQLIPEHELHLYTFRFYLQDLLWQATSHMMRSDLTGGITNYLSLLSECMEWASKGNRRIVFVSFNYDLLLEGALESYGILSPEDIDSYTRHPTVALLKPHGSVQWGWRVKSNDQYPSERNPYKHGANTVVEALKTGVDQEDLSVFHYAPHECAKDGSLTTRAYLIPALALPIENKSDFIWPDAQDERFRSLEGGQVTHLLTIGWRGAEKHFTDRLRSVLNSNGRALVVGKDRVDSQDISDFLARQTEQVYRSGSGVRWTHGYEDGFHGLLMKPWQLRELLA